VNPWITAAAVVVGLPGGAAVLHLSLLTAASLAYREPRPMSGAPRLRFLTLVPARNEATVLPETLARMVAQCREGDRVLVVADHCSDGTVAVAREAGADVFERSTGLPGRAAARQAGLDHVRSWQWDAIAMVDADCIVEPGFLAACERALVGADVLQVRAEAEHAGGFFPRMTTVAFAIQGVVVPRGRDRLRLSVRLRGMGMVMRRAIVERYSFRAEGASEDLWYSLDLCLDGIHPRHADSARLRARSVRSRGGATEQRTRWEAGRMAAAREFVPRLLRRHDRLIIERVEPRYWPKLAFITTIPGVRELLTWNCVIRVRKR